ncbi:tetratricopeptide repeat protein [Qipengyuania aurantiaca]|uniref:Tetratricopeptide repeat protein n=1 Tax=Qipengyuania aurantiaca TaxID=2867233 RepID=A0ABX8ZJP1_9SPHN|nr:tetratricopeptide repeat protein [Qipengyuania aurantiaca]QZD88951.1 tetratricopeptide repeat protein [Qipengyuania aurantiaca]
MLATILTALAGMAVGIVAMRLWQQSQSARATGTGETVTGDAPAKPAFDRTRLLLIGAGVLVAATLAVLLLRSQDDGSATSAVPGSAMALNQSGQQLEDVDTMIDRLAARLEANPEDGEGFRMLGWSYLMTNRPQQAIAPFERAIELLPQSAAARSGYGEALVAVAEGEVTADARQAFEQALAIDPTEPRARYFRGRWLAQQGKQKEALDLWIELANAAPPDAPWQADVRRDIDALAAELGTDVSDRLNAAPPPPAMSGRPPALDAATVNAANALPPSEQEAMIEQMVEGLATRLKSDPDNPEGWARLIRSRMVRGQADQAKADLATARKALAGNTQGLALVEAAAREAGVP